VEVVQIPVVKRERDRSGRQRPPAREGVERGSERKDIAEPLDSLELVSQASHAGTGGCGVVPGSLDVVPR
jgi:hypothetical protein